MKPKPPNTEKECGNCRHRLPVHIRVNRERLFLQVYVYGGYKVEMECAKGHEYGKVCEEWAKT